VILSLTTLASINSVLKGAKREDFIILYTSTWDTWSNKVTDLLDGIDTDLSIYIVNSFDTPEAFGTYKLMSAPSLVISSYNSLKIITEYSSVYKYIKSISDGNDNNRELNGAKDAPSKYRF